MTGSVGARVEHVVTSGTFTLDGQTFDVENNVWVLGDDDEVVVIDAPHDVQAIVDLVGGRKVVAVLATHAHDDHVRVAPQLAAATGAPVLLHPDDLPLWRLTHRDRLPDGPLHDGQLLEIAGTGLRVLHTPGHAPGACSFLVPALNLVFSGDTLFAGGPGATGRSYSDFPTLITSIRERLLTLPPHTIVHTGHGDSTTIGAEAARVRQAWIDGGS